LSDSLGKTKYGQCTIYITCDLNILVYPNEGFMQEPLVQLSPLETTATYNEDNNHMQLREQKKGIFNTKKDVNFRMEAEDANQLTTYLILMRNNFL
jgi:hypothetical protein